MKVLIHHHSPVFVGEDGIHLQSFIASWVLEISKYSEKVGLLLHETPKKIATQDFFLSKNNIVVESLGYNLGSKNRIKRYIEVKKKCRKIIGYDDLIIRGMTPRQLMVYNNINVNRGKFFLLVGSLSYNLKWNSIDSIKKLKSFFFERLRRFELKLILKKSKLLVNAPGLQLEASKILAVNSDFVPTNTIDRKQFTKPSKKKAIEKIKLLFCGRIEENKGVLEILNCLNLLNNKKVNFEMYFVGSFTDKKFEIEVQKIIRNYNLKKKIFFSGRVNFGERLFKYYRDSDIFLLPTYTEGFPHVLWEAAANCCPIITTRAGGIPSVLKNNIHALFVPINDYKLLCENIIQLSNNKKLRNKLIKNAHILATNFSVENCVEILINKLQN